MYWSGSASRWVGISWGVSLRMVRNFRIMKWVLWMPTRFCLKKTGPGESSLMATASPSSSQDRQTMPHSARKASSARLPYF